MDRVTQGLVAHFHDQQVTPERLQVLLQTWDRAVLEAGAEGTVGDPTRTDTGLGRVFAIAIAGALECFERAYDCDLFEMEAIIQQVPDAAMVVSAEGRVLIPNQTARTVFSIEAGESLSCLPMEASGLDVLAERLDALALASAAQEDVVQLHWTGMQRVIHAHIKKLRSERSRPFFLIVTSEHSWPDRLPKFLASHYALTPAEIEIVRWLTAGVSVGTIAEATRRSVGTIRTQLHSILEKTGTANQADLVRLLGLLRQSMDLETAPPRAETPLEPHHEFIRLRDSRRLEVLSFGDPAGVPVIRMQTYYGYFRFPRSAESDLVRRRIRMIVPIRAGWAGSDRLPNGCDVLDVAVSDLRELMVQFGIKQTVVLTWGDDIRIAMMLAQADPAAVRHIIGVGSGFPILNDTQYRRLIPVARFVRACARYAPSALPFLAKAFRATMLRHGIERYLRGMLTSISPADACAFSEPEIAEAVIAGTSYLYGHDSRMEAAACAEIRRFHEDWPEGLGNVPCPVTLIHGAQDGNAPLATTLEYCARYPNWKLIEFPGDGQLVGHVRWREVLDMVGEAAGCSPLRLHEASQITKAAEQ